MDREPDWPDGWHWSGECRSVAVGPKGRALQSVWVESKPRRGIPPTVSFSYGMDEAPVSVVLAVVRESEKRDPE